MRREVGEEGLSSDDEDIAWYDYRRGVYYRSSLFSRGGWFIKTYCGLVVIEPETENISRGPTFGDFVTILTKGSMQDNTVARLRSTRAQALPPPSIKCNVLRESLSEDGQNIPCATLKRRGSWVIFIHLCCEHRGN